MAPFRSSPVTGIAFALWLALGPSDASAQAYEDTYQTWASTTIQGNVTPDVQLYVDLNGRFYDDFHPFQLLVRPAIGLRLADGMYAWIGYGWTPSWNAQRRFVVVRKNRWTELVEPGAGGASTSRGVEEDGIVQVAQMGFDDLAKQCAS